MSVAKRRMAWRANGDGVDGVMLYAERIFAAWDGREELREEIKEAAML